MNDLTLVTGGTGTVGSALLAELLERGRRVRCLLRQPDQLPAHPLLEVMQGDVTDREAVDRAVKSCAVVFHLSGRSQKWTRDPSIYDRVNVGGTKLLLEAARGHGVDKFLYASTQDTLDVSAKRFDEDTHTRDSRPTPYERSKNTAQRLVDDVQGLDTRSLHLAGVYGGATPRAGSLNALVRGLAEGAVPMSPPGGLAMVYDQDVAQAFLLAESQGRRGRHYLIADRYVAMSEFAQLICEVSGASVPPVMPLPLAYAVAAAGEAFAALSGRAPMISFVDLKGLTRPGRPINHRAQKELGWTPTPLAAALRKIIKQGDR